MERFLHRGSVLTSTHQPERLVCSPAGVGGGWELRLGLQEVRPQEEDWGWLCEHSLKGASAPQLAGKELGKTLDLPKRQETIVLGCERRGYSFPVCPQKAEHCLNELQRWARATAISSDTRHRRGTLTLLLQPPRILCASTGHYPHYPGSL